MSLFGAHRQQKASERQSVTQYANDIKAAKLQRKWQLADQKSERSYNRRELEESRRYNEAEMARALAYNRKELLESRAYNRKELAESRAYSRGELGRLVQDAQKAGFNPLTVLRNGGAAGYSSGAGFSPLSSGSLSSGSLTSGALSATPLTRQAPVKQAVGGDPLGETMSSMGRDFMQDFLSDFDPFQQQKTDQTYRLIESQIASYNVGALSSSTPPAVQRGYGSSDHERRPSGKAAALRGNAPGEGTIVGGDDPTVSSMGWKTEDGEHGWFHAPWMPDAETWENIYGDSEVFSTLYGAGKLTMDGVYSLYRNAVAPLSKAKKVKPDSKYRKQYFRNIRESVPSLIR